MMARVLAVVGLGEVLSVVTREVDDPLVAATDDEHARARLELFVDVRDHAVDDLAAPERFLRGGVGTFRQAGTEGVARFLFGLGACVVGREAPLRRLLEDLPVEGVELVELLLEIEISPGVLACRTAHAVTQLWIPSEPPDGLCELA